MLFKNNVHSSTKSEILILLKTSSN